MPKPMVLHRKMSLSDPRHLMRHLKFQAMSGSDAEKYEALAKSEKVSIQAVRDSVRMVETYRVQNTNVEMELAIRNLVISAVPKAKETLDGLLEAMELVEISDPVTGKKKHIKRPDKTTRIEAMKIVTDLVSKVQPKGPLVEVNNTNKVQIANLSAAETTEERLRRLRKQAEEHNQLPPEVAAVPMTIDRDYEPDEGDEDDEGDEEDDE
jgi:glycine cleavage system H lipoate-binding protein